MSGLNLRRRAVAVIGLVWCAAAGSNLSAAEKGSAPVLESQRSGGETRALIIVKTLVIDGLGTRTVDTDTARVPFGSKGLLVKRVPYAGPALSFRLEVIAGAPQPSGIPLTLSADVWPGDVSRIPGPEELSHREEATVVAPESSYLLELDHDPRADRRVMISVSAKSIREDEALLTPPPIAEAGRIELAIQITRESPGSESTVENHLLTSMVGRPVSYGTGVTVPPSRPGGTARHVGLTVELNVESVQGELMTITARLSGADFVDEARTRLEPLDHTETRTVSSGTSFEVTITLPDRASDQGPGVRPVTYRLLVTPALE